MARVSKVVRVVKGEVRVYPVCCTSACCGKLECPAGCPRRPVLAEWEAWKAAGAAEKTDPVWCPTVWTATRDGEVRP